MPHPFRLNAIASLFVAIAPGAFAAGQEIPQDMNVVIVSGSRVEHTSFDFPAAIDVVGAEVKLAGDVTMAGEPTRATADTVGAARVTVTV